MSALKKFKDEIYKQNGRCVWQVEQGNNLLEMYQVKGKLVLIQIYDKNVGFNVYYPTETISLDIEMQKLKEYIQGHNFTDQDLDDIMTTALEGGINYWADKAVVKNADYKGGEWANEVLTRGGELIIKHCGDSDILTLDKLNKGINKYLQEVVNYDGINSLDVGDIDGEAADIIIQYALFGEMQYS